MAAPALWMNPIGLLPNEAASAVFGNSTGPGIPGFIATVNDVGPVQLNESTCTGVLDSVIAPQVIPTPGGGSWTIPGSSSTLTGMGTANVVDIANPGNGSGNANEGNFAVSGSNSLMIQWGNMNFNPGRDIANTMTVQTGWTRSYTLADSDAGPPNIPAPPPVFLHESYIVDFTCPPDPSGMNYVGSTYGIQTPGIAVAAIADGNVGLPGIVFETNIVDLPTLDIFTGSGSTTWTNPATGNAIHISLTPTELRVSTSQLMGDLPFTTEFGVVAGPAWNVASNAQLVVNGSGISGQTGIASLTTNYSISFSNYPTTV